MIRTASRWSCVALAAFVVGPVAAWVCSPIEDPAGGVSAAIFTSVSPAEGGIRTIVAILLALGSGVVVSRLLGWRLGCFCAGVALAWPAWEHAGVMTLLRSAQDPALLNRLAIEGAALGLVIVMVGWVITRADPRFGTTSDLVQGMVGGIVGSALAVAAATIVAGVVVWGLAMGELRGQAFAAGFFAALVGATAARFIGPKTGPTTALIAMAILATIAPILATVAHGPNLIETVYTGTFMTIGRLTPMLWASSALVGAPIGSAWAESMLEKHPAPASAALR